MSKRLGIVGVLVVLVLLTLVASHAEGPVYGQQANEIVAAGAGGFQVEQSDELTLSDADMEQVREFIGDGVVGLISCSQDNEYFRLVLEGVSDIFGAADIETVLYDSNAQPEAQVEGLNDLLNNENARALVVCALYDPEFEAALQQASADGVEIVLIEASHDIDLPEAIRFIDPNVNLGDLAGRYAGEYINEHMDGQANIAILDFPDQPSIVTRANASARAVCQVAPDACPTNEAGRTIPIPRFVGGTFEFGETSGEAILDEYPDTNVIISINDAGALGAIAAFEAAGKMSEDVVVVGIDGLPATLEDMANPDGGWFRGTVAIDIDQVAQLSVRALVRLVLGEEIEEGMELPLTVLTQDAILAAAAEVDPEMTETP